MRSPNPRILCVDDNDDFCELISLMLQLTDDSYRISAVSTARESLIVMEGGAVDLYILDYALPEMTGAELCRKIRQSDSQTPILFYSAMGREIDRDKAMAAGATEYLVKPNDLERLTETVQRLLVESRTAVPGKDFSVKSKTYDRIY